MNALKTEHMIKMNEIVEVRIKVTDLNEFGQSGQLSNRGALRVTVEHSLYTTFIE